MMKTCIFLEEWMYVCMNEQRNSKN